MNIPGFQDRIRDCQLNTFSASFLYLIWCDCLVICQTISLTYQTINRQELQLALGRLNNDDSNYIWIANHEEKIKFERKFIFLENPSWDFLLSIFSRRRTGDEYKLEILIVHDYHAKLFFSLLLK